MPARLKYEPGYRFPGTRLTYVGEAGTQSYPSGNRRCVQVICDCGTPRVVMLVSLTSGNTRSCGCLSREITGARLRTHGLYNHPLYGTWKGIRERCYSEGHSDYPDYGARGIGMHPDWRDNVRAFVDWVEKNLGPRPQSRTLDRINNDLGYEPGNLRWATATEQMRNRRKFVKNSDVANLTAKNAELEARNKELEALVAELTA